MLKAAIALLGRIGLLGAILMALAAGSVSTPAMAFEADGGAVVSTGADLPAPWDGGDCADCGPACVDGCHGPLVAVPSAPAVLRAPFAFTIAPDWSQRELGPLAAPTGPKRPPRA